MTLQERLDAEKAAAGQLSQRYQTARGQVVQMEQDLIRCDARMALLEAMLAESESSTLLHLVQPGVV